MNRTRRGILCISALALVYLSGPLAPAASSTEFVDEVSKHFSRWDQNHDSELSRDEIDAAVADAKVTGKAAAAIASLKRATRSTKYKLPPMTLANICDLAKARPSATTPDLSGMYTSGVDRITKAGRDLFPTGKPKLDTIHQGKLGNCFCLAPLGAMLSRDPDQVVSMFQLQPDGKYVVRLGKEQIHVGAPTDAEVAMTSSNEDGGIWLNLYEKAVGTSRVESKPGEKTSPLDALGKGGSAGTMLAYITGHEIVRFSCKFAKDPATKPAEHEAKLVELRKMLNDAVKEKRLITCGTLKTTTPGLTPNHAYAVLGYDAKSDHIRIWNPHGGAFAPKGASGLANGYPTADGVFEVPLPEYVQQFSGLAFEILPQRVSSGAK